MLPPQREHDFNKITVFEKTPKKHAAGTCFGTQNRRKSTSGRPEIDKFPEKVVFWVVQMCDRNADEKKRVEKGVRMAPEPAHGGSPDGMCTTGGRVREGKPSLKIFDLRGDSLRRSGPQGPGEFGQFFFCCKGTPSLRLSDVAQAH